jgi:hypothetical protein
MLHFFDYLYYRTCVFYNNNGEKTSYRLSALAFISTLHTLNLIFFVQLSLNLMKSNFIINKYYGLVPCAIILLLNGVRYYKFDYDYLNDKYGQENAKVWKRKGNALLIYILLSILGIIILAIWKANQ